MATGNPPRETQRPERRSDVEWIELDGEAVLYDPATYTLHLLNAAAAAVWARCDGTATATDISRVLSDIYSDPTVVPDVHAAIRYLRRANLLR